MVPRLCLAVSLFTLAISVCSGTLKIKNESEASISKNISKEWIDLDYTLRKTAGALIDVIIPVISTRVNKMNITLQCMKQSLDVVNGFRGLKPWAVKFLDASGKSIDGILTGTLTSFGAYDECLDIEVPNKYSEKIEFRGQYCSIEFAPQLTTDKGWKDYTDFILSYTGSNPILASASRNVKEFEKVPGFLRPTLRFGICLPSGCSEKEIDNVLQLMTENSIVHGQVVGCETKKEKTFSRTQILILCIFATLGLISLTGTGLEIYSSYKNVTFHDRLLRILLAFSLIGNTKTLLEPENGLTPIKCLNGMKFLTMSWIIYAHSWFISIHLLANTFQAFKIVQSLSFQIVLNGTLSVDTFFVIGGFLVCYNVVKRNKYEGRPLNVPGYIIHRVFRLLPCYAALVMFAFLISLMGSGPYWEEATSFNGVNSKSCPTNWWRNIFFVANLFPMDGTSCVTHTWYLDTDFQLYLLALFILIPLLRSPKVGIAFGVLGVLISVISSCTAVYYFKSPPTPTVIDIETEAGERFMRYFSTPLPHLGPYCIGILVGYFVASRPGLKIPKRIQILGWTLAFICNFSVLYGIVNWNRGITPPLLVKTIYGGLFRSLWAAGVAWVVLCCSTGHGGIVNTILSWNALVPLGRLSFVTYLIHPKIQDMFLGSRRVPIDLSHLTLVWLFFAYLVASHMVAAAGTIVIERPFITVGNILLESKTKKKEDDKSKSVYLEDVITAPPPPKIQGSMLSKFPKDFTPPEEKKNMRTL